MMNEEAEGMQVDGLVATNYGFEEVFGTTYYVGCRIDDLDFDGGIRRRNVQGWGLTEGGSVVGHGSNCVSQSR